MFEIYTLLIDRNLTQEEFEHLSCYVSPEKKQRIGRFYHFADAQRALLGDLLARHAICSRAGIKNSSIAFSANEYGKPELKGDRSLQFNISHSDNWVVCAIGDSPVGVDVETVKPIDFKLAERFFSQDEYYALANQQQSDKLDYFYKLWTLKESYIKAEGKGLSISLSSFSMHINEEGITAYSGCERKGYFFDQYYLDKSHIFAICTFKNDRHEKNNFNIDLFTHNASFFY
ncbi:4'-phosphopantetheinyl transferase [Anaerobacterium chartisolvens]|uniref:4'-phosphopantetheinyl transferase n=1 Tax=Anaerobacterium chartisolvens TaxID=1297424 RepID=A0A369AXG0_9FIRM|nr:4'-phosphopantetheinyl transferase superfamily protein [Anaerobacterium chartisolvens]RCX13841.1 4'-phosphopantetheinyl transferase [Anaerobacterium chartisolvens]